MGAVITSSIAPTLGRATDVVVEQPRRPEPLIVEDAASQATFPPNVVCRHEGPCRHVVMLPPDAGFTKQGQWLVPGTNVDRVDIAAGLRLAQVFGYESAEHQMVAEYALRRHSRGEEDGAQRTALSGGIDLTSWYAILAAAVASH